MEKIVTKGFTHERPEGKTNDWLTPAYIIDAFGKGFFDLDPCESEYQISYCARRGYTVKDDGLKKDWFGHVFCNPPYGKGIVPWIERMAAWNDGVLLIFNRMDTKYWHDYIFPAKPLLYILRGRINFINTDGEKRNNAGAGSVLVAFGRECKNNLLRIAEAGTLEGRILRVQ
jgi:hypothetical protein